MKTEEEIKKELEVTIEEQKTERNPDTWKHVAGFIGALKWVLGTRD